MKSAEKLADCRRALGSLCKKNDEQVAGRRMESQDLIERLGDCYWDVGRS